MTIMIYIFLVTTFVFGFIYQSFKQIWGRFFYVPSTNWREKIQFVLEYPKPIYLKVGVKRSSYRRRLITASKNPSFYTNFVNNKLKICPEDIKNENDEFTNKMKRRDPRDGLRNALYGFFHPYCSNGGGGERVMWHAVRSTLLNSERNIAVVYTADLESEPIEILSKASSKFDLEGLDSRRIVFIYLRRFSNWIDGSYWNHFTMLGQLVGSFLLSLEALFELSPDIWIDTQGLPGSYFMVYNGLKIPILSYVHYPLIQSEMFQKLKFSSFAVTELAKFRFSLTDLAQFFKLIYWSLTMFLYKYLASLVDVTLANGTWTYDHIHSIFTFNDPNRSVMQILYPPCVSESNIDRKGSVQKENIILYLAQYRSEKRHSLALTEFAKFIKVARASKLKLDEYPKLVFVGSCRTPDDTYILESVKQEVSDLEISEHVVIEVDCSYEDVLKWLAKSKFGLNAMWNEHFGIGVVEYLSQGVIPLCHASAGPLLDIMNPHDPKDSDQNPADLGWDNGVGFFFKAKEDYDFNAGMQDNVEEGFLSFKIGRQDQVLHSYPTLSKLLSILFIEEPSRISQESLVTSRKVGYDIVEHRFTNNSFTQSWIAYINHLRDLEVMYREERMERPVDTY